MRLRGAELLRVEGPEGIYAFPRVHHEARRAVVHLVNWNFAADGERGEVYKHLTLTLLNPQRWGPVATVTYYQPGCKPVEIKPERHGDRVRLTLPQIETWGVVEIR